MVLGRLHDEVLLSEKVKNLLIFSRVFQIKFFHIEEQVGQINFFFWPLNIRNTIGGGIVLDKGRIILEIDGCLVGVVNKGTNLVECLD